MKSNLVRSLVMGFVAIAIPAVTQAATIYQDSFSRSGSLDGTTPDVVTTNSKVWQNTGADFGQGGNAYVTNGSTVSQNATGPIDGWSYLPVNGTSGVTLSGANDFTLSATVSNTGGQYLGIGLATAIYTGGSMYEGGGATGVYASLGTKSANTVSSGTNATPLNYSAAAGAGSFLLELVYNASGSTLTYKLGGTTRYTRTSVTATDIDALRYVAIWSSSFGNNATATLDDFTLTSTVPEPASMGLFCLGVLPLLARRRSVNA